MDPQGWKNSRYAHKLHKKFLSDIREGNKDRWKFSRWVMEDYSRFSINALAWFGKDMKDVRELSVQDLRKIDIRHPVSGIHIRDEETMLSQYLPAVHKRPNDICGEALFGHFAFFTQRKYLDNATVLREQYEGILTGKNHKAVDIFLFFKECIKKFGYVFIWDFAEDRLKPFIREHLPSTYIGLRSVKRTIIKLVVLR